MSLALVADPDLRERTRCIRIIAAQTGMSALGAATWDELDQTIDEVGVGLIVYAPCLPASPSDAVERLIARTARLVLALDEGDVVKPAEGVTQAPRPIPEETLVLLARASGKSSVPVRASFNPIDVIQMICMSGASQVIVLSHDGADIGVIEVKNGEVWTAFDGLGVGEDAFARLIRPEMLARISPTTGSTKERTIFKGQHELVLDSLRRNDEGHISAPPRLTPTQFEAATSSPDQLVGRVRELTAEARKLLMERDYDAAAQTLMCLSDLDPTSHLVRANLEQLRRLGYPK